MREIESLANSSRMISRFLTEFNVGAWMSVRTLLGEIAGKRLTIDRAVIFLVLLQDHDRFRQRPALASAPEPGQIRTLSINGVATSLNRPFETVRRQIRDLAGLGVAEILPKGVRLAPDVMAREEIERLMVSLHDWVVSLVEDLVRFDVSLPGAPVQRGETVPSASEQPHDRDMVVRMGIDLCLMPFEQLDFLFKSWSEMVLVNLVIAAGVRDVTYHPELSRAYAGAHQPPPPEMRKPVPFKKVAAAIGLPRSTAQRHVLAAIERGCLVRKGKGLAVAQDFLATPIFMRGGIAMVQRLMQSMSRLHIDGCDFSDPSKCYLNGRPPRWEI